MRLTADTCRRLAASAPSAVLATTGPAGPHLVPIVLAVDGDRIVTVVDAKPKRTTRLRRLENLEGDPRCAVLVDHYEDDWDRLWWVRGDGTGRVEETPAALSRALDLLAPRYPAYADEPPPGPVIAIAVERWTGWAAAPDAVAE